MIKPNVSTFKLPLLFVMMLIIVSCEEEQELNVSLSKSGSVRVYILTGGQDFDEALVRISSESATRIDIVSEGYAGPNGVYESEKLYPGIYRCELTVRKGALIYNKTVNFHVNPSETTNLELNPLNNSGDLKVTVIDVLEAPIEGIHVALIPHHDYTAITYAQMEETAWYQGTTNSNGEVTFTGAPVLDYYYGTYTLFIYYDEEHFEHINYNLYIESGKLTERTIQTDLQNP